MFLRMLRQVHQLIIPVSDIPIQLMVRRGLSTATEFLIQVQMPIRHQSRQRMLPIPRLLNTPITLLVMDGLL